MTYHARVLWYLQTEYSDYPIHQIVERIPSQARINGSTTPLMPIGELPDPYKTIRRFGWFRKIHKLIKSHQRRCNHPAVAARSVAKLLKAAVGHDMLKAA